MWNVPRIVPATAEQLLPGRVAYYMGDYWPTLPDQAAEYWRTPARTWKAGVIKTPLAAIARRRLARDVPPSLALERVMFPTHFMRAEFGRHGICPVESRVVYGAVDTVPYAAIADRRPSRTDAGPLRLLYAGRLTREKGVHTAIEALGWLVREHSTRDVRLTIAGGGDPAYEAEIARRVQENGVERLVTFKGPQPRDEMPRLYGESDVLLFTSIWHEPFGRVLVEAMASGLAVIGTPTGGAAEILADGRNALVFPAEDARELARQIRRLQESPALSDRLVAQGRDDARARFDVTRMTREIESFLQAGLTPPLAS
jgi:glycosyltransferase involved in cell wall biosynthesis